MKKIISLLLSMSIIASAAVISVGAAAENCIRLSDSSGGTGYSAASDELNAKVREDGGATLFFDMYAESFMAPTGGRFSQIVVFTGGGSGSIYNFASYNFTDGTFNVGKSTEWVTNDQTEAYTPLSVAQHRLDTGKWYEIAFQFDGNETVIYLDGMPVAAAEYDSVLTNYIVLYPQFCNLRIDNIRVCGKDYNVRDRYGDVWASEDFSGCKSIGDSKVWVGYGDGYELSKEGRKMPEISEMLPIRTVSPSIDEAHLQYSMVTGGGMSSPAFDCGLYRGIAVVEDVRIDYAADGASIGLCFGDGYIAGYDHSTGSFMIARRKFEDFDTSSVYARTSHPLSTGVAYELGFRQYGPTVSVYLNGVLMVSAENPLFDKGFGSITLSHNRINASIDNFVAAYPDYNIREAEGSAACKFTFDERADYIERSWNFGIGTLGCSQTAGSSAPSLSVGTATAENGTATLGIFVEGNISGASYTAELAYPDELEVTQIAAGDGTYVSPVSENPVKIVCAEENFSGGEIAQVTFSTEGATENEIYELTATVELYIGSVPMNLLSASGRIIVPEAIPVGVPENVRLEGERLVWDPVDGAVMYEVYSLYEGDEEYIDYSESDGIDFDVDYYCKDPGEYIYIIYACDDNYEYRGVSYPFAVIRDDDGQVYGGYGEYADALYEKLLEFTSERDYASDDASAVYVILKDAQSAMASAANAAAIKEEYEKSLELLGDIPTSDMRPDAGVVTAGSVSGTAGSTVRVPVSVTRNPGFTEMYLYVDYDTDTMTLIDCVSADDDRIGIWFSDADIPAEIDVIAQSGNVAGDGTVFFLTFEISPRALSGKYDIDITVDYASGDGIIGMIAEDGMVDITGGESLFGDVTGDGVISGADIIRLCRIAAGCPVSGESRADLNTDGNVNDDDAEILRRIMTSSR